VHGPLGGGGGQGGDHVALGVDEHRAGPAVAAEASWPVIRTVMPGAGHGDRHVRGGAAVVFGNKAPVG